MLLLWHKMVMLDLYLNVLSNDHNFVVMNNIMLQNTESWNSGFGNCIESNHPLYFDEAVVDLHHKCLVQKKVTQFISWALALHLFLNDAGWCVSFHLREKMRVQKVRKNSQPKCTPHTLTQQTNELSACHKQEAKQDLHYIFVHLAVDLMCSPCVLSLSGSLDDSTIAIAILKPSTLIIHNNTLTVLLTY